MTGAREGEVIKAQAAPAARCWSFASAVLDERSLELRIENQPVELEPKPLEVLLHLLRHAGEVVTKDELLEAVWPGRVLSDSAITSCIKKLREALRDEQQELIKTVHGYGYRLVAPVKVEASEAAPPPHFDFKPGDHPPLRPMWSLVQRLGQGSHGEVWLAQHDKTREPRVYKFAPDGAALHSLKREITLYRLMHDALGDKCPALPVLDWNLEETPYFIETEHASGGSLVLWAEAQSGLSNVPLTIRLEIAAQCAEALAAAHSVGVLHKDLKPSNVLVVSARGEPPRIKLGDFGSGGVLDSARLEALGITRLGMTQTLAAHSSGGTPLYLAPEVVAGQPATIQADIYSLGVMLYQLVAGDLKHALAPGWERDVEDELLRKDIAQAAEGDHSRRLADAALLAQRLRTLEQRHVQRIAEQTVLEEVQRAQRRAEEQTQQARLALERMRGRRVWMRTTMAAFAVGTVLSLALLLDARRARDAAADAAATSKTVSDFLSLDMFSAINSENRPLRELSVKEMLDEAARRVPERLGSHRTAAAAVHAALGASYISLDAATEGQEQLEAALALADRSEEPGLEIALLAATRLIAIKAALGTLRTQVSVYEEIQETGKRQLGSKHPQTVAHRKRLIWAYAHLGAWRRAADEQQALIAYEESGGDEQALALSRQALGYYLLLLGDYPHAERIHRDVNAVLTRTLGAQHLRVGIGRQYLGWALTELGHYEEAQSELDAALFAVRRWAPSDARGDVQIIRILQGRLLTEQQRYAQAAQLLEDVERVFVTWPGPETDQSAWVRLPLAEAYQAQKRLAQAETTIRLALKSGEKIYGEDHPAQQHQRVILADILRERGQRAQAWQALQAVNRQALTQLPESHPIWASLHRVEGLLLLEDAQHSQAHKLLVEALRICQALYGQEHWRTRRAQRDLTRIPAVQTATGNR